MANEAIGGTITISGGYTIHTFTSSGTFTPILGDGVVEYLVVAGGGGGGRTDGGGGGAGGFKTDTDYAVLADIAYTITIGGGGAGSSSGTSIGTQGSNSIFNDITSTGGGGGASFQSVNGGSGGSGGGASGSGGSVGTGIVGQGTNGGNGAASAGGGGGGHTASGSNAIANTGGHGGAGTSSSISGSSVAYAGGGGGGDNTGTIGGNAGTGGGGTGGGSTVAPTNGTINTGGGGGGKGDAGSNGGNGGSGIVIVRYLTGSLSILTKDNSVKANIRPITTVANYSKGNVFRAGELKNNSSKASIITTNESANSVKANVVGEVENSVKANIQLTHRDKKYYYRIYNGQTFVTSWANEVLNEPSFRTIINGGSSDINIKLARNFDDFGEDFDVKLNNRVEVLVSDRESPNGHLIYSGYITGYRPILEGSKEYVEVTIFSWVGELSRYFLRDGSGNTEITYSSEDPSDILTDIIDKYRADGGFINYDATSIDLTGTTVSYTFNTNTVREALNKVIELCPDGWYWRITPQGVIHLHERAYTADHDFTLGKEITSMSTFRRIEDMVNRVYFTGGGDPALYRLYENSGSISTYGLYATKVVDQRVTDTNTALTMSNRIINAKKDPEIRTKISILDSNGQQSVRGYDIESVYVGQTMVILGQNEDTKTISLWDQMEWDTDVWDQTLASSANAIIQILSISYSPNKIMIEASSRLPEVPKRIEDINKNLQDSQTLNNPIAPS